MARSDDPSQDPGFDELEQKADSLLSSRLNPPPIPDSLSGESAPRRQPPSPEAGMWGMAKAWGTAFDFIFTIIAGAALGWGFDKWRGTAPTGIMVGIAIGFVVAFIRIVRSTIKQEREEARIRDQKSGPKPPSPTR